MMKYKIPKCTNLTLKNLSENIIHYFEMKGMPQTWDIFVVEFWKKLIGPKTVIFAKKLIGPKTVIADQALSERNDFGN